MSDHSEVPLVGESPEVQNEALDRHEAVCIGRHYGEMVCPCGRTHVLLCDACKQPVAIGLRPGKVCPHAKILKPAFQRLDWL